MAHSGPPFAQPNICRKGKATTAAKVTQAPQELCCSPAQRNRIDEHVTLTHRHAGSVLWRLAPASRLPQELRPKPDGCRHHRSTVPPCAQPGCSHSSDGGCACYRIAHSRPHQASSAARILFNTFARPPRYKKKSLRVRRPQGCNDFWKSRRVNVRLLKDGARLCFQFVCLK